MLRLIFTLSLLVGTFVSSGCLASHPDAPLPRPAPYARLYLIDGKTTSVRAFGGKTAVVLFWASWCSYSTPVLREFRKLSEELRRKTDVVFVAISVDSIEDRDAVLMNIPAASSDVMIYAYSGNEVADEAYYLLKGGDLPHFLIVNPDGIIVESTHDLDDVKLYLKDQGVL